jgi:hypothetical protein
MASNQNEWIKLINKEAWGIDKSRFGEVKDVNLYYVIAERSVTNKGWFYFPKQKVQGYDNKKVIFGVTEEEATTLYLRTEHIAKEPVKKQNILFNSLMKN